MRIGSVGNVALRRGKAAARHAEDRQATDDQVLVSVSFQLKIRPDKRLTSQLKSDERDALDWAAAGAFQIKVAANPQRDLFEHSS